MFIENCRFFLTKYPLALNSLLFDKPIFSSWLDREHIHDEALDPSWWQRPSTSSAMSATRPRLVIAVCSASIFVRDPTVRRVNSFPASKSTTPQYNNRNHPVHYYTPDSQKSMFGFCSWLAMALNVDAIHAACSMWQYSVIAHPQNAPFAYHLLLPRRRIIKRTLLIVPSQTHAHIPRCATLYMLFPLPRSPATIDSKDVWHTRHACSMDAHFKGSTGSGLFVFEADRFLIPIRVCCQPKYLQCRRLHCLQHALRIMKWSFFFVITLSRKLCIFRDICITSA